MTTDAFAKKRLLRVMLQVFYVEFHRRSARWTFFQGWYRARPRVFHIFL